MMKSIIAVAALVTVIATPAFAKHKQYQEGIFAGVPAGVDAYEFHWRLAANQSE
jgi:hypothetical protein